MDIDWSLELRHAGPESVGRRPVIEQNRFISMQLIIELEMVSGSGLGAVFLLLGWGHALTKAVQQQACCAGF